MSLDTLATARDVSILILFVPSLAVLLATVALAHFAQRGLGRLLARARPGLRQARETVATGSTFVKRAMGRVAAPFVWLQSVWAGLTAGLTAVRRGRGGGRSTWTTT